MASGRVPTTTAICTGQLPVRLPEQVRAFASAETVRGDEHTKVELVELEVVGHQVGSGQGGLAVFKAGVGPDGVAGGHGVGVTVGERDRVVKVDVHQAGYFGIGQRDLFQGNLQG